MLETKYEEVLSTSISWSYYLNFIEEVAVYPKSNENAYLSLGILLEALEVQEAFAFSRNKDCLLKELGDVLWFTCMLGKRFPITPIEELIAETNLKFEQIRSVIQNIRGYSKIGLPDLPQHIYDLILEISYLSDYFAKDLRGDTIDLSIAIETHLANILENLSICCYFLETDLDRVKDLNYRKLSSRLESNTLKNHL